MIALRQPRLLRFLGTAFVLFGLALLGLATAYHAYGLWAENQLPELEWSAPAAPLIEPNAGATPGLPGLEEQAPPNLAIESNPESGGLILPPSLEKEGPPTSSTVNNNPEVEAPGLLSDLEESTPPQPTAQEEPSSEPPATAIEEASVASENEDTLREADLAPSQNQPQQSGSPPQAPQSFLPPEFFTDVLTGPAPATRILIPAINLDATVVEMWKEYTEKGPEWKVPDYDVGHMKGTATPGEVGNIVMVGHLSTRFEGGSVFIDLPKIPEILKDGHLVTITLETPKGRRHYVVTKTQVVEPTDVWVMDPTPDETLTLITCVPRWFYTHRFIVTAKPISVDRD